MYPWVKRVCNGRTRRSSRRMRRNQGQHTETPANAHPVRLARWQVENLLPAPDFFLAFSCFQGVSVWILCLQCSQCLRGFGSLLLSSWRPPGCLFKHFSWPFLFNLWKPLPCCHSDRVILVPCYTPEEAEHLHLCPLQLCLLSTASKLWPPSSTLFLWTFLITLFAHISSPLFYFSTIPGL